MKKIFFITIVLFTGISCSKKEANPIGNEGEVSVKIIATICGNAVLQIQDPTFYSYGENGWKNGEDKAYDHVFSTDFSCEDELLFAKLARPSLVGLEFKVKFIEKPITGNCVRCLALLANAPSTRQNIKISTI